MLVQKVRVIWGKSQRAEIMMSKSASRWMLLLASLASLVYILGGCTAEMRDFSRMMYVDAVLTEKALIEYGLVQLPSGTRPGLDRYGAMVDTTLARRLESDATDFVRSAFSSTRLRIEVSPEISECHRNIVRGYLTGEQATGDDLSYLASEFEGRYLLIVFVEGFGFKLAGSSQAFMPSYPPQGTELKPGMEIQEGMAAVAIVYDGILGHTVWERHCEVAATFAEGGLKKPSWQPAKYVLSIVDGIVQHLPR